MEVYFDNAATTKVSGSVIDLMVRTMQEDYGNPSSRHRKGMEAEAYVRTAAEQIAATMKVSPKNLIFTSGGAESNNMALIGTALSRQRMGRHIITTGIEHASVYEPLGFLESQGFEVSALSVDRQGHVDPEELRSLIRPDTILVSVMLINNEIGAIEPAEELSRIIHEKNPDTWFHADAIQAYGKMRIYPKRMGIDLLSVSGHKIHGPKGIGFLYVGDGIRLRPILYGGGQQGGMRSGTINVPGIAGLGLAAEEAYRTFDQRIEAMTAVKDHLIDRVSGIEGVTVNSEKGSLGAPHIVSLSIAGVRAEVLLHTLEEKGIYVSSGSACSSHHPGISGTLKGIGLKEDLLDSTIRISLNEENTKEEADYFAEQLQDCLPLLRRFTRR